VRPGSDERANREKRCPQKRKRKLRKGNAKETREPPKSKFYWYDCTVRGHRYVGQLRKRGSVKTFKAASPNYASPIELFAAVPRLGESTSIIHPLELLAVVYQQTANNSNANNASDSRSTNRCSCQLSASATALRPAVAAQRMPRAAAGVARPTLRDRS
jgi:hypothetical protein